MKIEKDKIIETTETELYGYWLRNGMDDIYSFPEYKERMIEEGVKVIEGEA